MVIFKEVEEKDLNILASLYSVIYLNNRTKENWTYHTALSYMNYFYHYQPDLFICAYDDNIPIAAIMSILKPSSDGIHLIQTELFVSEDYRNKNIEKQLLEKHFGLAISKYDASHIDVITHINNADCPLSWHKKIDLEPVSDVILLHGDLESCLTKLSHKT